MIDPADRAPFLDAIAAAPEDDTVRLVYADWLDENGDPARADCIRASVAVHRDPGAARCTSPVVVRPGSGGTPHRNPHVKHVFEPGTTRVHCGACPGCHTRLCHDATRPYLASLLSLLCQPYSHNWLPADRMTVERGFVKELRCSPYVWELAAACVYPHEYIGTVVITEGVCCGYYTTTADDGTVTRHYAFPNGAIGTRVYSVWETPMIRAWSSTLGYDRLIPPAAYEGAWPRTKFVYDLPSRTEDDF